MGYAKGLSEIAVRVPDLQDGVRFYCEGLGMTPGSMDSQCARLLTPDGLTLLLLAGGEGIDESASDGEEIMKTVPGGMSHVCYHTWDADRAFDRAIAYGATPSRAEAPAPYTWQDMRMAYVRSPFGEEIEFRSFRNPDGTFGGPVEGNRYIRQVMHVAVTVPDMPAAIRFYEALGAEPKEDWGWGFVMRLPDSRELQLYTGGTYMQEPREYDHFTFSATQPERAHSGLIIAGGMPDGADLGIGPAGERIAFKATAPWPQGPKPLPDLPEGD